MLLMFCLLFDNGFQVHRICAKTFFFHMMDLMYLVVFEIIMYF